VSKLTAYASNSAPADADVLASVDVSDTSMAASGTTKKLALSDLKTYVKAGPAFAQGNPANPTATASQTPTLVMMGIGGTAKITPGSGGKVQLVITGLVFTNTAVVSVTIGGRFGTGTAPTNGAAVTGTRFGVGATDWVTRSALAGVGVPFVLQDLLTLTPGTAYWFDIALSTATAADTAAVTNLVFTAEEIS
jgi:hypothetical protein